MQNKLATIGRLLPQIRSGWQWLSAIVGGIAVLGYLTLWEEGTPQVLEQWIQDQADSEQPDAHIETLTTRQFGDNGALQFQIVSPKAKHYPKSDTTHFETPVIDYVDDKSRWRSTSLEGLMSNSTNSVILTTDVVLQQISKQARLTTNSLWVFVDKKTAFTPEPVTIDANGGTMQGIGLVADFDQQTLKLTSNVHGIYEKPGK